METSGNAFPQEAIGPDLRKESPGRIIETHGII
jgi:hypothetical protein